MDVENIKSLLENLKLWIIYKLEEIIMRMKLTFESEKTSSTFDNPNLINYGMVIFTPNGDYYVEDLSEKEFNEHKSNIKKKYDELFKKHKNARI